MDKGTFATADPRTRRNLIVLVAMQGLLGSQMPMIFTIGGLAGQSLASNVCFATLPISLIVFTSMLMASPMSAIMQRYGRRTGFYLGATGGAIGGAVGAMGLLYASFPLFLLGSAFTGVYMSSHGFIRFAAADTASDAFRPRAISFVMAAGLLAAILGTQLTKVTSEVMVVPFLGTYLAVIAINVVGSFLFLFLKIPAPLAASEKSIRRRSKMELLKSPRVAVAIIVGMVSYALMNLMMTSTPLAVVGCGHSQNNAADVVMVHVLAMYIPAFFTGSLIVRFGAEKIMGLGLAILTSAGLVGLSGVDLGNFFLALLLLGVGWNFGFIGATTMLTSAHSVEERGRVQGMNDMLVFGLVTISSVASGGLMNCTGGTAQDGWTAVNLAMVPFLVFAGATLIWLIMRPQDAD